MIVNGLNSYGIPSFGSNPLFFDSISSAQSYLDFILETSLLQGTYDAKSKQKFAIAHIETIARQISPEEQLENVFKRLKNSYEETDKNYKSLISLVVNCIQYGFSIIGFDSTEKVLDFINDPKYNSICDKCVPQYVREYPEKFIFNGILDCSPDDKGAILLTTSDEMLEILRFKK